MIIDTIDTDIAAIGSTNLLYNDYQRRWRYLLESYMGGEEYRQGQHLTRYQLETEGEYAARLRATPLDNHCRSVVSVYNSFLFREEPDRDFGTWSETDPDIVSFLEDADLDGRSLNAFMKDVATWSNVFGHCWIILAKPNVNAVTRADELAQGIRPYVSLVTPLVVLDWRWRRLANGRFTLSGLKYIEEVNGSVRTIKQWTEAEVRTWVVDLDSGEVQQDMIEPNELGEIPAVIAYSGRSTVRGIGISAITDIADAQRFIYNATSEADQSIRLDSHPSLVKTPETQAGIGAGSLIHMPENMDPGLKPYLLEYGGASIAAIYASIQHTINTIDKMANTGAVRATESRTMSGVAMATEFQLLNARLSEMADSLELAEEQLWRLWSRYQGREWTGEIEYPGSFNLRDTNDEIQQLQTARQAATDPHILQAIDYRIMDWLDLDEEEAAELEQYAALTGTQPPSATQVPDAEIEAPAGAETGANCPVATQDIGVNLANRQVAIDTARYGPLNPALPNRTFWLAKADMWNTDATTAKQSLCGNCSFFDQTPEILSCIEAGLTAGGTTGDEWDSVAGGQLGYCEAFDFKCKSTRTCDGWVAGGPQQ